MLQGKNILVTGGAGFIGSHIVESLVDLNNVTVIDNLSSGRKENLAGFEKDLRFVKTNIQSSRAASLCKDIDYIFLEAANVFVPKSISNPLIDAQSNILGLINILDAARKYEVKRVIFASSSSVYGDTQNLPIKESEEKKPLSPYAVSKLSGESYCTMFYRLYGLECVCLRYFNVFGPRQNPHSPYSGVLSIFKDKLAHGHELTIYGDGEQTRDFIYVSDVVVANLRAATKKQAAGGIFNVGTGQKISLNDIVSFLKEKKNAKITYEKAREGDILHSCADTRHAEKYLGFKSKTTFFDGFKSYLNTS